MGWYDLFALFYDPATEAVYRPYRERISAALELPAAATVVDLACGTGQNFPVLSERVGPPHLHGGRPFLATGRKRT